MIDNVVYERSVSECFKIGYLQQQQIQKILTPLPSVHPHPHYKILRMPLLCPVLRMKSQHTFVSVCPVTLCVCCRVYFVTFV